MTEAYDDWKAWPLSDIIEYADEIAASANLDDEDRAGLRESMWGEAGYGFWMKQGPSPRRVNFPRLPSGQQGDDFSDEEWLEICRRCNEPIDPLEWSGAPDCEDEIVRRGRWEERGEGLTKRWVLIGDHLSGERQAKQQAAPFRVGASRLHAAAEELLWRTGHFRFAQYDGWVGPKGMNEPHKGLYWYYMRVVRWRAAASYYSTRAANRTPGHVAAERALFCAMRLGQTFVEMEMKATHDQFFQKAQRTREAQVTGGRHSWGLNGSPETRRQARQEAWLKYRRDGYSAVKAGEQAGEELGVSETTIRRSFGGTYPEEVPVRS